MPRIKRVTRYLNNGPLKSRRDLGEGLGPRNEQTEPTESIHRRRQADDPAETSADVGEAEENGMAETEESDSELSDIAKGVFDGFNDDGVKFDEGNNSNEDDSNDDQPLGTTREAEPEPTHIAQHAPATFTQFNREITESQPAVFQPAPEGQPVSIDDAVPNISPAIDAQATTLAIIYESATGQIDPEGQSVPTTTSNQMSTESGMPSGSRHSQGHGNTEGSYGKFITNQWYDYPNARMMNGHGWTEEADLLLWYFRDLGYPQKKCSEYLQNFTPGACQNRWQRLKGKISELKDDIRAVAEVERDRLGKLFEGQFNYRIGF